MCTALVRLAPDERWPLLVAFVRDEQRDRETDPPGEWWPHLPTVIGGRDRRGGGTWLAVDVATGTVSFLTNHFDPLDRVQVEEPITRGHLPLDLHGTKACSIEHVDLERHEPFHLVRATARGGIHWHWTGHDLLERPLVTGLQVIASLAASAPGEHRRRRTLLDVFGAATPDPDTGWDPWVEHLDGTEATMDDYDGAVLAGVPDVPGFGTVGASLVGIAADGRIRYDVNPTTTVDPGAWQRVRMQ